MRKLETEGAPKALGPYSQGIEQNGWVFASGQLPIDPATGKMVEGDIKVLTRRVIGNLEAILKKAGLGLADVVKTEVFLTDLSLFKEMNEEYALHFKGDSPPARQTIQAAALPLGSPIEISCIASGRS
jgi:2-iminobutanoate/2-iminopropanoate deaminase